MSASQKVFKVRRHYNKWVADQTLEDYSLRYTAQQARSMSIARVAKTALGATAFLALESLAAVVTLNYGFTNAISAILAVLFVFFVTGFPIAYYSAKHGLDIDLLTRGAGFGYLGSTFTSLIYATFTFIFFAIEAAILASALEVLFNIPLSVGYIICAVFVIPIVTHGIKAISKFQLGTQTMWVLLQCAALFMVLFYEYQEVEDWSNYSGIDPSHDGQFDILLFGAATSILFALMAQIGEQVDYLRFMPTKTESNKKAWWFWLIMSGPGWVFIGAIKMLLGSFLAYQAINQGVNYTQAIDPTHMYQQVFQFLTHSPNAALILAAIMVFISQMKINVTNAYAGSLAWSNFFSRLTHSHPGRVVWLVFNVTIALLLMELGIHQALAAILGVFAIAAVSWLSSLAADLLINKPLGLSPSYIEFKRAHLYDINPVGSGSMLIACLLGFISYLGVFGEVAKNLCHFVSLVTCFICVPALAYLTKGKYYLSRQSPELDNYTDVQYIELKHLPAYKDAVTHTVKELKCSICENTFEQEDMSFCTAYQQPICSLCCTLDVRCLDHCKPHARVSQQIIQLLHLCLPYKVVRRINSRIGRFIGLFTSVNLINAALLSLIYLQMQPETPKEIALLSQTMWTLFFVLLIVSGVLAWLFLLAYESRLVAQKESNRQTRKLIKEIEAHDLTDKALQNAKELAENANAAKSRYLTGISHELRTPLQSIIGYAQLLAQREDTPLTHRNGLTIIQRSSHYLTDLIEGLLDISKIEAGRLDLYRNNLHLTELITQLADMFQVQAEEKGISFQLNILNTLPEIVVADEKRLRQILINLLSNAVKYTQSGGITFEIRYRNQVAEFRIQDTGAGIPQEYMQRIFEPFERVQNQQVAAQSGTGLGLTIVKLLVEIMGGDLKIESTAGKGSCFAVSLMLPWVNNAKEATPVNTSITGYQGPAKTLCIVDDDPVLRGLLTDLLTPVGFTIVEAADSQACLDLLEQHQPDLYLLDISMPGMNGIELAQALREQEIQAPIIMLSADAEEQHLINKKNYQNGPSTPYNHYLVKPISNYKLFEQIANHLRLQWIYRDNKPPVTSSNEPSMLCASLLPDLPLLRELKAYAELGYRKGVQDSLLKLRQGKQLDSLMLDELDNLNQGFQFEKIIQYLERCESSDD